MQTALMIWTIVGLICYVVGVLISRRYDKNDVTSGLYAMPGMIMLVYSVIWATALYINWLMGVGLALAVLYGLYLLIRTDSQAANDRGILFTFIGFFGVFVCIYFLV